MATPFYTDIKNKIYGSEHTVLNLTFIEHFLVFLFCSQKCTTTNTGSCHITATTHFALSTIEGEWLTAVNITLDCHYTVTNMQKINKRCAVSNWSFITLPVKRLSGGSARGSGMQTR